MASQHRHKALVAELATIAEDAGFDVVLEVSVRRPGSVGPRHLVRPDMVVSKDGRGLAVVEAKTVLPSPASTATQCDLYRRAFGLPVILVAPHVQDSYATSGQAAMTPSQFATFLGRVAA